MDVFNFRIVKVADGVEVFDPTRQTPYNSLTAAEMIHYINAEQELAYMDMERRKYNRERQREHEEQHRQQRNILHIIAALLGR